jgi:CMP-N,N'-diacetyllegionaminic acid synthase
LQQRSTKIKVLSNEIRHDAEVLKKRFNCEREIVSTKLDIVALIPARSGSKGVKDKNLLLLNGHPLIGFSVASANQSKLISEVYITTDSEKYASIAKSYGAIVPFLRPEGISNDFSTDKEFFLHFIDWCKENRSSVPDMIVHLRPSSPLRDFLLIDEAIQKLIDQPEASSLRSCQNTEITPYKLFFENNSYMEPCMSLSSYKESYNMPRQIFPKTYLPNGYVDIIRPKVLINSGSLHGEKILLNLTPKTADIDDIHDYESAKQLLDSEEYSALNMYLMKSGL